MKYTETELVARFQRSEPDAFATLYKEQAATLFRFCCRLTGSVASAEDLTQETFVAAFQGRERFEGRSSLQTWLYRIALYTYRAKQRSEMKLPIVSLAPEAEQGDDGACADGVLTQMAFAEALAKLPEDQREAFVLVRVEALTHREAAELLGVPLGTVQAWVYKASQALRREFDAEESKAGQGTSGVAVKRKAL